MTKTHNVYGVTLLTHERFARQAEAIDFFNTHIMHVFGFGGGAGEGVEGGVYAHIAEEVFVIFLAAVIADIAW